MVVETAKFGRVVVPDGEVIYFESGLIGFEDQKEFFLYPVLENPAFQWLQSKSDPSLAILLVDPFVFCPGYEVILSDSLLEELAIKSQEDVLVFTTISFPDGDAWNATTNLLGPIVINNSSRKGKQIVLDGTTYSTRHRLFPHSRSVLCEEACG